ncbi:MAG: MBL fold metallo-hydrolase [Candidatus Sulfobium sp.]|jgi:hydroxyacylglutathione hydrolase
MRVDKVVVGQLDVNCFIVSDGSSEAMVIDPGDEADRISWMIEQLALKPRYILFTHAHYDHVCAGGDLKNRYGASIIMHEDEGSTYLATKELCTSWGYGPEDFPTPDILVKDGDSLTVGSIVLKVLHTPGHTPGGICLCGNKTVFTGDTLFRGAVGRTDLPGGDMEMLSRSLRKILTLPSDTRVLCGHGEETTLFFEREHNPFLSGGK